MRTKSKTLVCLLLGLVMLLSLAGFGIVAFAAENQTTEPESSFDSNGWYTQAAYQAKGSPVSYLDDAKDSNAVYVAYHAPEEVGAEGYTHLALAFNGKVVNNQKLDVTKEINFEIGIQAVASGHDQRLVSLFDSAKLGNYVASSEANTPFGLLFARDAKDVQVFISSSTPQTLANDGASFPLNTGNTKVMFGATYIMHYVRVVIGTEDTKLYIDDTLVGTFTNLTREDYASGYANMVFDAWGGGTDPWVAMNHFDPFVVSSASVFNTINVKTFKDDLTIGLSKPVSEVKVNAKGGEKVLEKGTDYTVDGNKITITNEFLTGQSEGYFDVNTTFTFTSDEDSARTTALNYTVLYYNPPVYEQAKTTIVKGALTEDVTFTVDYENSNETYGMTVNGTALEADKYTATWADDKITVTLDKDYLTGLTHGVYTFELSTLAGKVSHVVYRNTKDNQWIPVGNGTTSDQSEATAVDNGKGSTTFNIGFLGNIYYSESLDVTKTIYIEFDMNKVVSDPNPHGWIAIGLHSDVSQVMSMNEANSEDRLTFLYGHAKGEFQCGGVLANAIFKAEYINQNGPQLFAIDLAEANPDGTTKEGQMTTLYFNGQKVFETDTRNQATFEKGCFLGVFSAVDVLNVTTRTNPASPAANTYGLEYTLGANTDVSFNLYNTTAVSEVKYGDEQLAADAYSFDAATGKLTIKGSYLQTIAYADVMRFTVVADGVELKANIKALCEVSADKSAVAAVGENGAVFENAFDGKTVTSVVDMDTMEELTSSQFTFEGGKLTVAKEYFTENKTYSFAVVAGDDLYFAMAIAEEYENGWANKGSAETGTVKDGVLSVEGEGNYLSEEFIDLTAGAVAFKVNITNVNGYFLNGLTGTSNAHVAVYLYDLYSGNTLTVEIHANDDPETAQAGAYLGYLVLTVRDKNGNNVYVNNTAIPDSKNFHDGSVIGENTLVFRVENGSVVVELGGMPYYFNSVGNTVLTDLRLGVSSTADVEEEKMAFSVTETEVPSGDVHEPTDGGKDEPADNGWIIIVCVVAAVVVIGAVAAVVIVRKKKAGKTSDKNGQDE